MDKKLLAVMGLAMALPSTVLAISWVVLELIDQGLIGYGVGIAIILAVIGNIFYLMFRHLKKQKHSEKND